MVLGEKDSIPIKSTMLAATYQVRPLPLTTVLSKPVQYVHLSLSNPVVYQRHNREYMLFFFYHNYYSTTCNRHIHFYLQCNRIMTPCLVTVSVHISLYFWIAVMFRVSFSTYCNTWLVTCRLVSCHLAQVCAACGGGGVECLPLHQDSLQVPLRGETLPGDWDQVPERCWRDR